MSQQVKLGFSRDPMIADSPIKLKTLQLADGKRNPVGPIYVFAEADQDVKHHSELMESATVKSAVQGISKERNPFVTLKTPLLDIYLDEDRNPHFKNKMLDELFDNNMEPNSSSHSIQFKTETEQLLAQQVSMLQRQLEMKNKRKDLNDLVKKFVLQPFTGKSDAKVFMRSFEDECQKYDVLEEKEKVDALRSFCKEAALTWWDTNRSKLSVSNWSAWKSSFIAIFGPKTWREARIAYGYIWKFGPYRDYALEKERLLLELDSTMSESIRIDNIVIGLPLHVQDDLNRDSIKTVNQLINELTQLNPRPKSKFHSSSAKSSSSSTWRDEPRKSRTEYKTRESDKSPCMFCELIGYKGNFHPVDQCRNRRKAEDLIKSARTSKSARVNMNRTEDTSESESDGSTASSGSEQSHRSSKSNRSKAPSRSGN